jgi:hypothetical protein
LCKLTGIPDQDYFWLAHYARYKAIGAGAL